ncbi:MAG TPA: PD-(D/E)XK nuclease family protein, partial [Gemmatimonadaceae bacterium]|nr:PD-(D/E)XK nuclease family protein [Gemmatimonadaceae bacterium]
MMDVLADDAWGMAEALAAPLPDEDARQRDLDARELIRATAGVWNQALEQFGGGDALLDAEAFGRRLALLLEQDLITQPVTGFGVVVGEALAAGWRAFDHVFVAGLSAGVFPQRAIAEGLFDAGERRAMIAAGLPLEDPDAWRAREQALFHVLCAAPRRSLTLSWPAADSEGREVARSAYADEAVAVALRACPKRADDGKDADDVLGDAGILEKIPLDRVLTPGFPIVAGEDAVAHARAVATREWERTTDASAWNGEIEDPDAKEWLAKHYGEDFTWSATQLEHLAKCGWSWFAARVLRLETKADGDDLMEPTTRGALLHDALDRFFKAMRERNGGKPVFLREADKKEADAAMAAVLDEAWNEARERGEWLGPDALHDTVRAELGNDLRKYLAFEITRNEASYNARTNAARQVRTGAEQGELAFNGVEIAAGGARFLLRGKVDRVDRGVDERVPNAERYIAAIDYKSSASSTPAKGQSKGWEDGVVLQVPLYAAALRAEFPSDVVARIEYRTLRSPKVVHPLVLVPLHGGKVQAGDAAEQKLQGALDAAGRRVLAVRGGILPAAPA